MFASGKTATVVSNAISYIEDVFSTWLHTGNGSTQTITNGIDLSTKGGLVWVKRRDSINSNNLTDTARGANYYLLSNATSASTNDTTYAVSAFNTNGFSLPTGNLNASNNTYASWTFRKQPKFFDVVTYTGTGLNTTVSHNLNATVGFMLIKCTSQPGGWVVYHRSVSPAQYLFLQTTDAATAGSGVSTPAKYWNSTAPTSTVFSLGDSALTNESGQTYVAYLFAHNAGGFGLTGTDNVISCGSYTGDGAATKEISLGYEPQWVMVKNASSATNWLIVDQMRGMPVGTDASKILNPNLTNAETSNNRINTLSATGFLVQGAAAETNASGATYIYIAIRRGPMKVPTSGTSVFSPVTYTGNNTDNRLITSNFSVDMSLSMRRDAMGESGFFSRLTGDGQVLFPSSTASEDTQVDKLKFGSNLGVLVSYVSAGGMSTNQSSDPLEQLMFKRAPSFFDVVCYTGTGSLRTVTHNLAAVPELMIVKRRNTVEDWNVYNATIGNTAYLRLNTTAASATAGGDALWGSTTPTSSVFTVKTSGGTNASGGTYVAYLFATCAGVSKVGGYTGTAALQTVNCGFTSGARFVLIKRTDSTGDWWLYDSARGITSGNDPYVFLNSTAAEVTSTNYVDTDTTGFKVTAAAPAGLNASGGTYIFLAIA